MVTTAVFAQGFYFRAGLGYAFAQAGQTMYDSPTPYNGFPTGYNGTRTNTANSETYSIKNASFSAGFQGGFGFGYMFTDNIGVQLDGGIGLSNKTYTFNDNGFASGGVVYNMSTSQEARTPLLLMPSLILQTNGSGNINAYTRFGIALPLNTKITQDQVISNAPGTGALTVDDFTWQLKSSFSIGFTAAAGIKYKINDRVSIWGEVSLLSMSLNAKEQDLTNWTENGQSISLSQYNNAQTIKYSKSATVDSTFSQLPAYSLPFSNIGISFGITTTLSHSTNHHSSSRDSNGLIDNKPYRRR